MQSPWRPDRGLKSASFRHEPASSRPREHGTGRRPPAAGERARTPNLVAMCGIIAIVSRRPTREVPGPDELIEGLDRALTLVGDPAAVAAAAARVDAALHGLPG